MKRIVKFIATPLLVLAMVLPTFASSPGIVVSNKKLPVSAMNKEGKVLVPLRAIFESLNATVDYDSTTKTITGNQKGKTIILRINDKVASVNGEKIMLDVPATLVNGSVLVPVRFIGESLGATVDWHNNTVLINSDIPLSEEIEPGAYEEFVESHRGQMLYGINDLAHLIGDIFYDQRPIQELEDELLKMQKILDGFVAYEPVPDKYTESHKSKVLITENFKIESDLILSEISERVEKMPNIEDSEEIYPREIYDQFKMMVDPLWLIPELNIEN